MGQIMVLPFVKEHFQTAQDTEPVGKMNLPDVEHKMQILQEGLVSLESMYLNEDAVKTLRSMGARGQKLSDEAAALFEI